MNRKNSLFTNAIFHALRCATFALLALTTPLVVKAAGQTPFFLDYETKHSRLEKSDPSRPIVRPHPDRVSGGKLDADAPQFLIYEPLSGGAMRLVGVQFVVLAGDWRHRNSNKGPPALDGNLLNFVGEPNRYGLPAFYELHVWAWENNPNGTYADWNTQVTCERQSGD